MLAGLIVARNVMELRYLLIKGTYNEAQVAILLDENHTKGRKKELKRKIH